MKQLCLVIIGAQKAGTTSINLYLAQHPNVVTHLSQEFGYFADENSYSKSFEFYRNALIGNVNERDKIIVKHVGLMYNPSILKDFAKKNPNLKYVCILRNPIDRAFSAFQYCRQVGLEPYNDFEFCFFSEDKSRFKENFIALRSCDYRNRSLYYKHIQTILDFIPKSNIQFFLFEEIIKDFNSFLNKIILNIDLESFDFDTNKVYNVSKASRFQWLSFISAPGKSSFVKRILPLKYRVYFRNFLKKSNGTKNSDSVKVIIDDNLREKLISYFKDDVKSLETILPLNLKKYWPEFFTK